MPKHRAIQEGDENASEPRSLRLIFSLQSSLRSDNLGSRLTGWPVEQKYSTSTWPQLGSLLSVAQLQLQLAKLGWGWPLRSAPLKNDGSADHDVNCLFSPGLFPLFSSLSSLSLTPRFYHLSPFLHLSHERPPSSVPVTAPLGVRFVS